MTIEIYATIAANAVKYNFSENYIIWCMAKSISNGEGKIDINTLKKIYIDIFKCGPKTFQSHLQQCNIFFEINKDTIYLKSIKNIVAKLDPIIKVESCFEINLHSKFEIKPTCLLINCVLGADKNNKPLSLSYISKALGLNKSTITRNIHKDFIYVKTNSRHNPKDPRKFWSSYIFIGGKRKPLKNKTGLTNSIVKEKSAKFTLKKSEITPDKWDSRPSNPGRMILNV